MSIVRCDNCGWGNPGGITMCQKCNQPLSAAPEEVEQPKQHVYCVQCGYPKFSASDVCANCGASGVVSEQIVGNSNSLADAKATRVLDFNNEDFNQTPKLENINIPAVGVDPRSTIRVVENLETPKAPVEPEPAKAVRNVNSKSTVRDFSAFYDEKPVEEETAVEASVENKALSGLKLVPMDGISVYGEVSIDSSEGEKVLCRENVDKGNPSIDVVSQASVSFESGKWYISNLSPQLNTFVCKKGKIELEAGDIVVVGNRRYIVQ